jgi:type II secretory pathway component PulJ
MNPVTNDKNVFRIRLLIAGSIASIYMALLYLLALLVSGGSLSFFLSVIFIVFFPILPSVTLINYGIISVLILVAYLVNIWLPFLKVKEDAPKQLLSKKVFLPTIAGFMLGILFSFGLLIAFAGYAYMQNRQEEITRLEKEITEFQNSKVELKKENIRYVGTIEHEGGACKNVQGLDLSDDADSCMLIGITLQFPQKENVTGVWKYIQKYDQYVRKDPVIDNNRREPVIDAEFVIEGQVVPKQNISIIYDSRDYSSLESTGVLEIYFTVITQNIVGTEVSSYMRVLCGHALKKPMAIRFTYFPSPASYVNLDNYTTSMDIALPEGIFADIYKYTYPGYMPAECAPADWTP